MDSSAPDPNQEHEYQKVYEMVLAGNIHRAIRVGIGRPRKALRTIASDPYILVRGMRMAAGYRHAQFVRKRWETTGLTVPPVMLMGITARCNLACSGCYMKGRSNPETPEMTGEELRSVIAQAAELGVVNITCLGGEPLLRWKEISSIAKDHPEILFPLFTNGSLIDDATAAELARTSNIIPFISFEGFRSETDARRGSGVYDRLLAVCRLLDEKILFFGCSVTITRDNFGTVLGEKFIRMLIGKGAGAIAYIQYVPTESGTEHLVVTPEQRKALNESIDVLNRTYPALFMAAPGDVERYGGCLAGSRGFVYVNPSGQLEPCAMAPYPVADLRTVKLKDALASPFLAAVRANHRMLKPYGRCPLRTNDAWVRRLMDQTLD
jgi:MoaA/NifB/PqqE/SkfB family radical SAM enzyme